MAASIDWARYGMNVADQSMDPVQWAANIQEIFSKIHDPSYLLKQPRHYIPVFVLHRFCKTARDRPWNVQEKDRKQEIARHITTQRKLGPSLPSWRLYGNEDKLAEDDTFLVYNTKTRKYDKLHWSECFKTEYPYSKFFEKFTRRDLAMDKWTFKKFETLMRVDQKVMENLCLSANILFDALTERETKAQDAITLKRGDVWDLRKYFYLLTTLRNRDRNTHLLAQTEDMEDARAKRKKFMDEKGLGHPRDLWLHNVEAILNTPHYQIGTSSKIFDFDREDYRANARERYMVFWEAGANDEFLLTDNSFGCFEGCRLESKHGMTVGMKPSDVQKRLYTRDFMWHQIFVLSPKLVVALCHGTLMHPTLTKAQRGRYGLRPSILQSLPHPLPHNYYKDLHPDECRFMKQGWEVPEEMEDHFGRKASSGRHVAGIEGKTTNEIQFQITTLSSQQVALVNMILLLNQSSLTGVDNIAYRNPAAIYRAITEYEKHDWSMYTDEQQNSYRTFRKKIYSQFNKGQPEPGSESASPQLVSSPPLSRGMTPSHEQNAEKTKESTRERHKSGTTTPAEKKSTEVHGSIPTKPPLEKKDSGKDDFLKTSLAAEAPKPAVVESKPQQKPKYDDAMDGIRVSGDSEVKESSRPEKAPVAPKAVATPPAPSTAKSPPPAPPAPAPPSQSTQKSPSATPQIPSAVQPPSAPQPPAAPQAPSVPTSSQPPKVPTAPVAEPIAPAPQTAQVSQPPHAPKEPIIPEVKAPFDTFNRSETETDIDSDSEYYTESESGSGSGSGSGSESGESESESEAEEPQKLAVPSPPPMERHSSTKSRKSVDKSERSSRVDRREKAKKERAHSERREKLERPKPGSTKSDDRPRRSRSKGDAERMALVRPEVMEGSRSDRGSGQRSEREKLRRDREAFDRLELQREKERLERQKLELDLERLERQRLEKERERLERQKLEMERKDLERQKLELVREREELQRKEREREMSLQRKEREREMSLKLEKEKEMMKVAKLRKEKEAIRHEKAKLEEKRAMERAREKEFKEQEQREREREINERMENERLQMELERDRERERRYRDRQERERQKYARHERPDKSDTSEEWDRRDRKVRRRKSMVHSSPSSEPAVPAHLPPGFEPEITPPSSSHSHPDNCDNGVFDPMSMHGPPSPPTAPYSPPLKNHSMKSPALKSPPLKSPPIKSPTLKSPISPSNRRLENGSMSPTHDAAQKLHLQLNVNNPQLALAPYQPPNSKKDQSRRRSEVPKDYSVRRFETPVPLPPLDTHHRPQQHQQRHQSHNQKPMLALTPGGESPAFSTLADNGDFEDGWEDDDYGQRRDDYAVHPSRNGNARQERPDRAPAKPPKRLALEAPPVMRRKSSVVRLSTKARPPQPPRQESARRNPYY